MLYWFRPDSYQQTFNVSKGNANSASKLLLSKLEHQMQTPFPHVVTRNWWRITTSKSIMSQYCFTGFFLGIRFRTNPEQEHTFELMESNTAALQTRESGKVIDVWGCRAAVPGPAAGVHIILGFKSNQGKWIRKTWAMEQWASFTNLCTNM